MEGGSFLTSIYKGAVLGRTTTYSPLGPAVGVAQQAANRLRLAQVCAAAPCGSWSNRERLPSLFGNQTCFRIEDTPPNGPGCSLPVETNQEMIYGSFLNISREQTKIAPCFQIVARPALRCLALLHIEAETVLSERFSLGWRPTGGVSACGLILMLK